MEKESLQKMALIEDEMFSFREKMKADVDHYTLKQRAESNYLLLTKEYLELKKYEAISKNAKIFFGDSIPNSLFLTNDPFDANGQAAATAAQAGDKKQGRVPNVQFG